VTRLRAPAAPQAAQLLEQLRQWRESHRERCWPVPPETGWAYAEAERKKAGSGLQKGCAAWEGSAYSRAERNDEIQAACFGASLSGRELLSPEAQDLALALFTPLLDQSEAVTS
jgi:exodeoxyribonuclease V gamma subunit